MMTNKDESLGMLTNALVLAIEAPTDEQAARAIGLAQDIADIALSLGATDKDIELCKKAALCVIEYEAA